MGTNDTLEQNDRKPLVVLITGGTQGVGHAIAQACHQRGAQVFVTSRRVERFPEQLDPDNIQVLPLDICSHQSILDVFTFFKERVGQLDVLINNAGIGVFKSFLELEHDEVVEVFNTNVVGSFFCAQQAYGLMRARGGRIINIGSIVDRYAAPGNTVYATSKHALRGLSSSINEDGKHDNVTSTHISLGAVLTKIWEDRPGYDTTQMLKLDTVGGLIANIVFTPCKVRIDNFDIYPQKGLL